MTSKKPSIKEVAKLAGVSTATVSNVFSGRKPVNDELKLKVMKVASQLGYQVDRAASQLRSGRTRVIAVLVPDITDTFFATIVSKLETMAYAEGYDVIVASSHDDPAIEASRINALMAWRPAGLIVMPCSNQLPEELHSVKAHLPMVLVDRVSTQDAFTDTVTIENKEAGRIAARHLLEMGHKDILLAVSDLGFSPIRDRSNGAADLIEAETSIRPTILELSGDHLNGEEIFSSWLEINKTPDAVIALTNVTTLSVLSGLAKHKLDIPNKISLVAFDDYAWMAARNTGLTAIRQPVEDISVNAWNRLCVQMTKGPQVTIEPIVLKADLIQRASVKNLNESRKLSQKEILTVEK